MDKLTPLRRSANMRAIRSSNTEPEILVRQLIYKLGYRYRLHSKHLPGKPDLVFPGRKKVIFVHGCFWHQHGCKYARPPRSNQEYWLPKLTRTQERDIENLDALRLMGWDILVIWECQTKDLEALTPEIIDFLENAP